MSFQDDELQTVAEGKFVNLFLEVAQTLGHGQGRPDGEDDPTPDCSFRENVHP